jgi:uncharacterized protein (TIGR02757 family)
MPDTLAPERLEALYQRWHHRRYLGSDPLTLLHAYDDPRDREVAALVVSSLAIGRASLITVAAGEVLAKIGRPLAQNVRQMTKVEWKHRFEGFRYRFFSGTQIATLLDALGEVLCRYGTLEAAFATCGHGWEALQAFSALFVAPERDLGILLPVPDSSGAFKRLNLFLRWMVRCDELDPGGWQAPRPSQLFMPIDTHVLQWAHNEGLTDRKSADRQACLQITGALARLCPEDPLRWDFSITRQGMDDKRTLGNF